VLILSAILDRKKSQRKEAIDIRLIFA
jgi:predicted nucleotidyltransferase